MIKVLFVCLGNICRSPMAEFVFRDMVQKRGLADQFHIASAATSSEELGNPVHYGTTNKLKALGISTKGKYAVQLKKKDYQEYDYILGMEYRNIRNIDRIVGSDPKRKVHMLLDFSGNPRDIADPWYTGNFDRTYDDILEGCEGFLNYLISTGAVRQVRRLSDKLWILLFVPAFAFVHDLVRFMKDIVISQIVIRPLDIHDAIAETALIAGVTAGLEFP